VAHVWAWYPNPKGPFAEDNPYLAPYGGAAALLGHSHARSGTEIAYSEFNHRSSGVFLLLIAAVIFWESRRQRVFPWNTMSAVLWIIFGVYLFVRSDPEAWPWGPRPFTEIFTDPEVLEHKILTMIPVAIGLIEGFRAFGWLPKITWGYLFPVLAILGGASLFFHFHRGTFDLDWIYIQHVAMGLLSLATGVILLFARRSQRSRSRPIGALPVILLLFALVLLFYSES
jgi:putative copper resistance protein D